MLASAIAELPALPLHTAGKYVAGAYLVFFVIVLIYVSIMAVRLSHIERDLGELLTMLDKPDHVPETVSASSPHTEAGQPGSIK
jgi:hypothetical protein